MAGEPANDARCFVGSVIVHYQMYLSGMGWNGGIHRLHELQKLLVAMTAVTLADYFAGRNVQRSEQRRRTVPFVIVGPLFRQTGAERQNRLRTVEGLHLRFFIHAKHNGVLRRVQVQTYDVPPLFHQPRISGQLECLAAVRLQPEASPDANHRALAQPDILCEGTGAAMGGRCRNTLKSSRDGLFYLCVRDPARRARPRIVRQPLHPVQPVTLSPLPHGGPGYTQLPRALLLAQTFGRTKHYLRPNCPPLRRLRSARQPRQLLSVGRIHYQRLLWSSCSHAASGLSQTQDKRPRLLLQ